nr:MAG TPA: hypothetical protein [Caudoviricetes sp.]
MSINIAFQQCIIQMLLNTLCRFTCPFPGFFCRYLIN